MQVKLLTYTQFGEQLIAQAAGISRGTTNMPEVIGRLIANGHMSVLEHASATFLISGISRACSHQLVRHRLASYTQASQRYIESDATFVVPDSIKQNQAALDLYEQTLDTVYTAYKQLLDFKIKREDARFILPNASTTELIMTANLREWWHILKLRLDKHSQWEIRGVAAKILVSLKLAYPMVFNNFTI